MDGFIIDSVSTSGVLPEADAIVHIFLLLCETRATQVPSLLSVSDLTGRDLC